MQMIRAAVSKQFSAADAGLKLGTSEDQHVIEITSDRVFIDDILSAPLESAATGRERESSPIL